MFRKAQLKLFAIITSILLAVFIAVLGSINIIMQAVMQRQSKDVLKKIAAGVEYDDRTKTFTITRPEAFGQKYDNRFDEPPSKPTGEPGTDETLPASTEEESSTAETQSEAPSGTESGTTQPEITPPPEKPTSDINTQPPERTTSAQTTAATAPTVSRTVTTAQATTAPQPHTEQWTRPAEPDEPDEPDAPEEPDDPRERDDRPPGPPWWKDGHDGPIYPHFENWDKYWESYADDDVVTKTSSLSEELYGTLTLLSSTEPGSDTGMISDFDRIENSPEAQKRGSNQIPKSLGSIDFFIVMADKEGNYLAKLNNDDLDEATAQSYISAILKEDVSSGMIDKQYQFYQMNKSNGTIMVFTDKSAELDVLSKLIRTTILIGVISLIVLAAAAFFLSRQVMKPLKSAFEKQKQFISDASHELKTPLTVISANADVLSGEIGDNKWLMYIKSQTDRMNVLVNDLLNLTRLENNTSDFIKTDFDLSKAIVNTALPFECQAFETNKQFDVDVEEGLSLNGSERHIKQMAAIFIDNALKYSGEGGKVKVTLKKQGERKVLTVFNTGSGVKAGEEEKIFERFYRSDESRNRSTGGYGLGLAIAKSIIDKHKFRVHVENNEGKSIAFIVTM